MSGSSSFEAFRHPGVSRFALGRFLSAMATSATSMALGFQLYEKTDSAFSLGLVGLIEVIPVVFLALASGAAADRYPRRNVAIIAHVVIGICTLSFFLLTLFGGPTWAFYVLLFFQGVGLSLRGPSVGAMIPQLVPAKDFVSANTWFSSLYELAAATGPGLGGLLIGFFSNAAPAFLFAFLCHLAFIAVLFSLPLFPAAHRGSQSVKDLLAGLRFVSRTKVFLAAITLDMFAVLLGGAVALLPIFAKDILDVGPHGLGWLRAAPAAGALLMAVLHSRLPAWKRPGVVMLITVAGFGVATIGFGLSTVPLLSFICLFFTGVFDNVSVVIRSTLEQSLTPDSMRGRVGAINQVFIGISNELGSFESGTTAALFSPVISVVGGGIGTLLVVLAVSARFPQLRTVAPLHELQPLPIPDDA